MRGICKLAMLVPLALATLPGRALANDTTFTYQGSLKDGGGPASGSYNMTFRLFAAASGGSPLASQSMGVSVTEGVFTVQLDFGQSHFNNSDRWLEIVVNGSTLSPRQPVTRSPYAITTRGINVNSDGQVGIGGTATTTNMLTIRDEDANLLLLSQGNDFGPKISLRNNASGISSVHGQLIFDDGSPLTTLSYVKPAIGPDGFQISGASTVNMKITDTGFIGMGGELNPQSLVHIQSSDLSLANSHHAGYMDVTIEAADAGLGLYSAQLGDYGSAINLGELNGGALVDNWSIGRTTSPSGAASTLFFKYGTNTNQANNSSKMVIAPNGNVGIGVSVPQAKLHVVGTARVNVLEVLGADIAERFPVVDPSPLTPGMVVEIDPDNPGGLRLASGAYSGLVAGVVSGANGLPAGTILGNLPGAEDAPPIALTGRVWVWCDASEHAISPGSLLTTSSTPGHAMRASDPDRAHGATIGKAMTALDRGETGLVLVLVGLQ